MHYQFEASDYMYTYILLYEKCVGNCSMGVRIFLAQGGMRKIGWFRIHTTIPWYTCYIYIYTTTTCAPVCHLLSFVMTHNNNKRIENWNRKPITEYLDGSHTYAYYTNISKTGILKLVAEYIVGCLFSHMNANSRS